MKAYYLEPGQPAKIIDVQDNPQHLSELVGGYLEQLGLEYSLSKGGTSLLVNEDGLSLGLQPNFRIHLEVYGDVRGCVPVVGNALLVKYNGEGDLIDLEDGDVARFQEALER